MRCNRRQQIIEPRMLSLTCVGAASHPITLRHLRVERKRYAEYCFNDSDKSVTARPRCVDIVGMTRCLQDKSSNTWPDSCRNGNDFTNPPKCLTQLLLKLIKCYWTSPHVIAAFLKQTHHTHVEVMRNLSDATLLRRFRTSSISEVHTKGRDCFLTSSQRVSEQNKPYNLMSNKTVIDKTGCGN